MTDARLRLTAAFCLVIGTILGMAGTFVQFAAARGLAWGLDGTALIVAAALLAIHHSRCGHELAAAGSLVFLIGEGLILLGAAMDLGNSAPSFAAGASLWAASLALVRAANVMPRVVSVLGFVASTFFAYPFFAATLFGWAWTHYRNRD